jgi:hypothetical protein
MRVPLENLCDEATVRQYLERGFLNQHQTGKTRGTHLPAVRARVEDDLAMLRLEPAYGSAPSNPVHEIRPKYAFLHPDEDPSVDELPSGGGNYGSVFVAFASAVKRRSTWTKVDSLTTVIQEFTPPLDPMSFDLSPLAGVYLHDVFPGCYARGTAGVFGPDAAIQRGWSPYSEAQIWGKLDFADVRALYVLDTERQAFMQSSGTRLLLSRFNVPVGSYTSTVDDDRLRLRIVVDPAR